jgi:hypothetical protein
MSKLDALLERMAAFVGISPSYTDAFGQSVETRPETQRALLAGLGLGVDTLQDAQESLQRLEGLKAGAIPAVIPVEAGRPPESACAAPRARPRGPSRKRMAQGMRAALPRAGPPWRSRRFPWATTACRWATSRRP